MTGVLVVDDQALIRAAVTDILDGEGELRVLGQAGNGQEALALAEELEPDVVIMDLRMPVMDGIEATSELGRRGTAQRPAPRVLVLTTFEEDEHLLAALRAGASGFVGKGAEPEEIVHAVRVVAAGDALLSPAATRTLVDRFAAAPVARPVQGLADLGVLTERELEVLLLIALGYSNHEIAEQLVISPLTAKTHANRIMAKVQAHDRAQLVILAYETGLLRPAL